MTPSLETASLRIIAQRGPRGRDWSAWLEDEPQSACGGPSVAAALNRWLQLNRERFPGPWAVHFDDRHSSLDRRVVILSAVARCPDCRGTGKYVGLSLIEDCRHCGGTGLVAAESVVTDPTPAT